MILFLDEYKSRAKSYYSSFADAFEIDDIKHISDCTVKSLVMMGEKSFHSIPRSMFIRGIKDIIQHRLNFKWNEKLFYHQHVSIHIYTSYLMQ